MARYTEQDRIAHEQNAYKKHVVGKMRAEWGDAVPADADDDEVLGVWADLNVPSDATQEDIDEVINEVYAKDYIPPKMADQRTLMEKAQDVGSAIAPAIAPLAANVGAIIGGAAPGMAKIGKVAGKTTPAQIGLGAYYGTRLAGEGLAGAKLEKTANEMPRPNIADLRARGYSEKQIQNIVKGYVATQQSLMGDLQQMGESGVATATEAIANAAVTPAGFGMAEAIGGAAAKQAATKVGLGAAASQIAGTTAARAVGGSLIGSSFMGADSVVHRATEAVRAGEGANTVLGQMTKGILGDTGSNALGAIAGQPIETAGAAAKGMMKPEGWLFGAGLGGTLGAIGATSASVGGAKAARALKVKEAEQAARTLSVGKFADEFKPEDLITRFNDDLVAADAAGADDITLAANLVSKLHPDMVHSEAGLKTVATVAEKIKPWRAWKAKLEGAPTARTEPVPAPTPDGLEVRPLAPGEQPIGPQLEAPPMAQGVVPVAEPLAPDAWAGRGGMAPEPNLPPAVQGPMGVPGRPEFVPPQVKQVPLEPPIAAPGVAQAFPEATPEVRVPTSAAELNPQVVAPPEWPRGMVPENAPPAVQGPVGPDRPVPFVPPSAAPMAEGIDFGKMPVGVGVAQEAGRKYMRAIGREPRPLEARPVNKSLGTRIAKAYEQMAEKPTGKEAARAKSSYDALNKEVAEQYKTMQESGIEVEFVDRDPYTSSAAMRADVQRGKLKVLKTSPDQAHPYMTPEQNNIFRAVHDFYGHAADALEFGAKGEDNAWRKHATMLSDDAIPALTTETRGQNSWVNFSPENVDLPPAQRPFAKQKFGLLPEWTYSEVLRKEGDLPITPGVKTRKVDNQIVIDELNPSKGVTTLQGVKAVIDEADKLGLPVQVRLEPTAGPKGGTIPVEKQAAWYEKQGFKVVEKGEGFAVVRRAPRLEPVPPVELVGEHQHRIATGLREMAFRAQHRLDSRRGRLSAGVDPADIRDYSLVLASDMFSRGIRTKAELRNWGMEKWGKSVEPILDKVIERAQKHFARMFKTSTVAEKNLKTLLDLGTSGKHGANWYEKTAEWAEKNFGDDADMMLRFLAVTSANGQTESGAAMALKAFAQWKSGMPFEGFRGDSMVGQLERAAKGEQIGGEFSKIEQFYRALKGDPDAIVLDRWMMDALNLKEKGGALRENDYRIYAQVVEDLAEMNGMTPRQFQAAVWEGARIRKAHITEKTGGRSLTTKSGSARPLEDLVDRKLGGMTIDEYIAANQGNLKKMENLYTGLAPVRLGENSGHTFNPDTWAPSTTDGYVATVATTVVPKKELYPGAIVKFTKHFEPLMKEFPGKFTVGVFKMPDGSFSVDLNLITPDRGEALRIGFKNRQYAIGQLADGGQYQGDIDTGYNPKEHGPQFLPPTEGAKQASWFKATAARVRNYLKGNAELFD